MVVEKPVMEQVPIAMDQTGAIRVSGTRVLLDMVVIGYQMGEAPEEIAENFSVPVADVYDVIAYYLRNRAEVDGYLEKRAAEADVLRKEIEALCPPAGIKERLLARRRAEQS